MRATSRTSLFALFAASGLATLVACSGGGAVSSSQSGAPQPVVSERIAGFNFGPYLDGQSPDFGSQISENQLTARLQLVAPLARSIRTYSMTHGVENAGRVAHSLGLGVTAGAFLSRDLQENERQKANLLAAVNAGHTDSTVILGSEVLERGDLSEAALISELRAMRQALPPNVRLGYADTVHQLLAHPDVVDQADVVFVNIYPYFDGAPLEEAMRRLDFLYARIRAVAHPKPVVLSETGWPSAGPQRGGAIPSSANAAAYFRSFVSWAKVKRVDYFYFEAFDEAWKTAEGAQGPHWGVLDAAGNMKSGMSEAFSGALAPDAWTREVPGSPGAATLHTIAVPPLGSFENLRGRLTGVDPALHRIAIYIQVSGLWWSRPGGSSAAVYPSIDGEWSADITHGPADESATHIRIYALPASLRTPPSNEGLSNVPDSVTAAAVAQREIVR